MKANEYEEMEPVPMFTGWVGTWDHAPVKKPAKKKAKGKKVQKTKAPFGFYIRRKSVIQ